VSIRALLLGGLNDCEKISLPSFLSVLEVGNYAPVSNAANKEIPPSIDPLRTCTSSSSSAVGIIVEAQEYFPALQVDDMVIYTFARKWTSAEVLGGLIDRIEGREWPGPACAWEDELGR